MKKYVSASLDMQLREARKVLGESGETLAYIRKYIALHTEEGTTQRAAMDAYLVAPAEATFDALHGIVTDLVAQGMAAEDAAK